MLPRGLADTMAKYRTTRVTMPLRSTARRDSSWLAAEVWVAPAAVWVDRSRMFTRLRSTSRATSACCSAALAITRLRSLICEMAAVIFSSALPALLARCRVWPACSALLLRASTVSWVPCWIPVIICSISSVEFWVRCASERTSSATTAKPRPASPARAASMAALRASRLVCPAMPRITSSTLLMS